MPTMLPTQLPTYGDDKAPWIASTAGISVIAFAGIFALACLIGGVVFTRKSRSKGAGKAMKVPYETVNTPSQNQLELGTKPSGLVPVVLQRGDQEGTSQELMPMPTSEESEEAESFDVNLFCSSDIERTQTFCR